MAPDSRRHVLDDLLINLYQSVLRRHADNPDTGACPVCDVVRCQEWHEASIQLLAAGVPADDGRT